MADDSLSDYPEWGLLCTWVALVESDSFIQAASRLGLTPPAVSKRVKMLENKLGTQLLERGTRPAKITLAGRRLYEKTTKLILVADQLVENMRGIESTSHPVLRLGCVDSFAGTIGPVLYQELSSAYRQVRLWSGLAPTLVSQLANRQLDAIISTAPDMHTPGLIHVPLFTEQYIVVLPAEHRFAPNCAISDLGRRLPLIRYTARSKIGADIDQFLERHGEHLERTCEFDTSDPMMSLVAAGAGFAITTPMCLWQSRHSAPRVRTVKLESLRQHGRPYTDFSRTFHLSCRQGELGDLPQVIEDLTQRAMNTYIIGEIERILGLPHDLITTSSNANLRAQPLQAVD